jgi:tetratricopeptide (TPR) repeat protein
MYQNQLEEVALKCNKIAMEFLNMDKYKESLSLLQKAELLLNTEEDVPNRLKLLSITLNNLGCYYKKKKQYKTALKCLTESLELEMQTETDNIQLGSTHLNICAILSCIGSHRKAQSHAQQALLLLHEYDEYNLNHITNLVISYYNCGAELEHLAMKEDAIKHYELGYEIAASQLGTANHLTISLLEAINKFNHKNSKHDSEKYNRLQGSIEGMHSRLPYISTLKKKSFSKNKSNRMNRTMKNYFY